MVHKASWCHNWPLSMQNLAKKILFTLILEENQGLNITLKIILYKFYKRGLALGATQYRWKTIQTGFCNLVKGDCHCLIEVTT